MDAEIADGVDAATTSSGAGGMSTQEWAARAASFGSQAAAYAEHRPDYPDSAIAWGLAPVRDRPGRRVLDLGAGTGKLTAGVLATGAAVVAVEPDANMLAELVARYPDAEATPGTAERIPLPDASVDAVVVGQALHWFDMEVAMPEIARVLRPGGVMAALWNIPDDRTEWVDGYLEVAGLQRWSKRRSQASLAHPRFGEFEMGEFGHAHRRTAESLVAALATYSDTLIRTPEVRAAKLDAAMEYLRGRPETASGEFDYPLMTLVCRGLVR